MVQAQLINRNLEGHILVEKVSKDAGTYSAGKYYIPGVAMKFGEHPEEKRDITGHDGKYGLYVKCGKVNASLKNEHDPNTISLETAVELINVKRAAPKRARKRKKKKK